MESKRNAELFSDLTGCKLPVAQEIMNHYESLRGVTSADPRAIIQRFKGFTKTHSKRLSSSSEMHRRISSEATIRQVRLSDALTVYNYMKEIVSFKQHEQFYMMIAGGRNQLLRLVLIAEGGVDSCIVDQRKAFKEAILEGARAIIIIHNHPSGDPEPSPEDHSLTKKFNKAGDLLGIELLDHVIIGKNEYYSFREEGIL